MKKICSICCGSKTNEKYYKLVENTAISLGKAGYKIKYGGSNVGLMGKLYETCKKNNIEIVGIIPDIFKELVDEDMKKDMIFTNASYPDNFKKRQTDIIFNCEFVAYLPGGAGTIYELFEAMVFNQITKYTNKQKKDIVLISKEFWSPLINMLNHIEKEKFIDKNYLNEYKLYIVNDINEYLSIRK